VCIRQEGSPSTISSVTRQSLEIKDISIKHEQKIKCMQFQLNHNCQQTQVINHTGSLKKKVGLANSAHFVLLLWYC
jgi:hypothetical protein